MAEKFRRTKTKYTGIYFNETTKKYDIKYNYKVYNPDTNKNDYKQKWKYGIKSIKDARTELAKLQNNSILVKDKDITLEETFHLWLSKANTQNFSPATIKNTASHMVMLYQFIPKGTKMKDITAGMYEKVMTDVREHGYSDETIHSINATLRKLIHLCYKKKLLSANILASADNIRTKNKDSYRIIPEEDFFLITNYLKTHRPPRQSANNYPKYRFLFVLLYYTGIRLGECLALQYDDFEFFSNYKKGSEPEDKLLMNFPAYSDLDREHLMGTRVKITKTYLSRFKITKEPKNFKEREIILDPSAVRLYQRLHSEHKMAGGADTDRIFPWGHTACNRMLQRICQKQGLPLYHCHEFRHTFISNLISKGVSLPVISEISGDAQDTILKRYSHMLEKDEVTVLKALSNTE